MKKFLVLTIFLFVCSAVGFSQQAPGIPDKSLDSFACIEILHEGRVKPLDSFARAKLLEWSARSSYKKESAVHFLARLFFDPDSTMTNELFRVNNPEVIYALGLSEAKSHRYSLDTLRPALQQLQNLARTSSEIEEKKRGPVDREALRLFENVNSYLELLSAFRFAIPREDFAVNSAQLRKDLGLPQDRSSFSYIEIREVLPLIQKKLGRFSPDRSLENLSPDETALFAVSKSLMLYSEYYRPFVLPILPMTNGTRLQWESPWKLLTSPSAKTEYQALGSQIANLAALGSAWQAGDAKTFESKAKQFGESAAVQIRAGGLSPKPGLEIAYNRLDPFYLAKIFYAFALIGVFLSLVVAGKILRPLS
ncbi:MAG: hypothetical protein JNM63_13605, partial [Spirochaetia bacterium]|nr:hypothetical protein [Spirochaetia bacterium]